MSNCHIVNKFQHKLAGFETDFFFLNILGTGYTVQWASEVLGILLYNVPCNRLFQCVLFLSGMGHDGKCCNFKYLFCMCYLLLVINSFYQCKLFDWEKKHSADATEICSAVVVAPCRPKLRGISLTCGHYTYVADRFGVLHFSAMHLDL